MDRGYTTLLAHSTHFQSPHQFHMQACWKVHHAAKPQRDPPSQRPKPRAKSWPEHSLSNRYRTACRPQARPATLRHAFLSVFSGQRPKRLKADRTPKPGGGTKNRTDSIDQDISQTDPPRERPDENIECRTKKPPNAAPSVRPRITIRHPCSTSCGSSPEATRAPGSAVGSDGCFNLFYNLSRTTVNRCVTIVSTTYSVGRAVTDTSDLLLRRCCIA